MKKQLDSLRIEQFRQIKELSIPELGHVNLVVGGNNSGKSTLLEALRFFAFRAGPTILEELLSLRGELHAAVPQREATLSTPASGEALRNLFFGRRFPMRDGQAIYVGNVSGDQFVRLEHVLFYAISDPQGQQDKTEITSPLGRIKKVSKPLHDTQINADQLLAEEGVEILSSEHLRSPVVVGLDDVLDGRSPAARYERHVARLPCSYVPPGFPIHSELADAWDGIVLTPWEQTALQALSVIEPQTEALAFVQRSSPTTARLAAVRSLLEDRIAVLKLKGQDSPVPLQSMGDGMVRVLQLTLAALRAEGGLLLIDEFENGLHHSVQANMWELLFQLARSRGLQVFATTHSNDCARAFCDVSLKNTDVDGKLLKLERMPDDGRTVAAVLGEQDLSNLLDAGIEVRG